MTRTFGTVLCLFHTAECQATNHSLLRCSGNFIQELLNLLWMNFLTAHFAAGSSDGFHMYVGKNNYQNEELSFKFASGNDWWFHAKGQPGSHVIVKTNGEELPDRTFEEAGRLAAYYSKGRQAPKVEIDYTLKKNLRKPTGGKPGFVVYYTNYSLLIEPDITGIQQL